MRLDAALEFSLQLVFLVMRSEWIERPAGDIA